MSHTVPETAAGIDPTVLANTTWVTKHMEKIEAAWKTRERERALTLIDEGLDKVRQWSDVRLWEMLLLRQKYMVLMELGRRVEAAEAVERADEISESLRQLSE